VKLVWSRRALADLTRIAVRIAKDKPLAAEGFVIAVREKAASLEQFPLLGRVGVLEDVRELIVHKNYLITYRVRADKIDLLQVWHVAQRH
jgi:toxin ParE1/3/4